MSPISAEMNGNVSNAGLVTNSSNNPSSNQALSTSAGKGMLEDSGNSWSDHDGVNFNNSSSADSTGPMTSTPIVDRSFGEICGGEQPTSSTGENCNYGMSIPKYGTLIPNRVFVGGISCHTTETELLQLFSKFGTVRGTKIIMDRTGVSKGYGFVTFETEEEAKRLYNSISNREMPPIVLRDRRLNIAPAVKKQPTVRPNTTYGSQGSVGASSTTFSPPPFDAYFYHQGQTPSNGDFFVPPMQVQDGFGFGGGGYPGNAGAFGGNPGMGPMLASIPNLGIGQAMPGPNGTVIFLPMGMPYQQVLTGHEQNWSGNPLGSGGGLTGTGGSLGTGIFSIM